LATGQLRTNWGQSTASVCLYCSKVPTRVFALNNQPIHYDGCHGQAHGPLLLINTNSNSNSNPQHVWCVSLIIILRCIELPAYSNTIVRHCANVASILCSVPRSLHPRTRFGPPRVLGQVVILTPTKWSQTNSEKLIIRREAHHVNQANTACHGCQHTPTSRIHPPTMHKGPCTTRGGGRGPRPIVLL